MNLCVHENAILLQAMKICISTVLNACTVFDETRRVH
jgi:hypothetical protein